MTSWRKGFEIKAKVLAAVVAVLVVLGGSASAHDPGGGSPQGIVAEQEWLISNQQWHIARQQTLIDEQNQLIGAQEELLNAYRCLYGVDLHMVPARNLEWCHLTLDFD